MKYFTVFEQSGKVIESIGYTQCLADLSLELGVLQQEIYIDPDYIDGNQHEQVFIKRSCKDSYLGDARYACIYTEDQYAKIKK